MPPKQQTPTPPKMSSQALQQKAAGYMLAAANASKKEAKGKK
jgi:hypothetical protein